MFGLSLSFFVPFSRALWCETYHLESLYSFFVIFFGYIIQNTVLWVIIRYFPQLRTQKSTEKIRYGPYHWFIVPFNLFISSCFAAGVTEASLRGITRMTFEETSIFSTIIDFLLAFSYQSILEYYWHLLMHTKHVYARWHKYHHFYKAPEPFCDLYIHPIENFGYQCILWSAPCVLPCSSVGFILYMIVMGICGVVDHSGLSVQIGPYDARDHDLHHSHFNVNYAFPLPIMDWLNGTYQDPKEIK
jgi:sterol desaturase/sphingolipid hydroxylase (fatty acid hydroxylase superfamily)